MEPLATYEEKRIAGKRLFRLFPDHLNITGQEYLGGKYELTISLASLDTAVDRMTAREPLFNYGFRLLGGGSIAHLVVVSGLKVEAFNSLSGLAIALGLTGLVIMLVSWRQREWVILKNLQGQQIENASLSCGSGQREQCGHFVDSVRAQLVNIRSAENAGRPDDQT